MNITNILEEKKMNQEEKIKYAHVILYKDEMKTYVWDALCEICNGNPRDEELVINFEKGKAFTR